jgi:serine protease Do
MTRQMKALMGAMLILMVLALTVAAAAVDPASPFIEDKKIEEITRTVAPSVVKVEVRDGVFKVATGVVIDKDGDIITTALISPRDEKITVVTADGKRLAAEFKGFDTQTQLAVIQTTEKGLAPIALGKSADVKPGAWIGVVGLSPENTTAVTQGIVSSVASDKMRLNVWVVPGASGSPVVNDAGRMVGVLRGTYMDEQPVVFEFRERQVVGSGTVISRGEAPSAGMALAVPVDIVTSVASDIIKSGKVQRGWLGVSSTEKDGKVEIADVESESPAQLAKLKEGDIVVKVDAKEIASSAALQQEIRNRKPGTDVTVRIERDGKPMDVKVKLGEYTEVEAQRELEILFPNLFPPLTPRSLGTPRKLPPDLSKAPERFAFETRKYIGVTLQDLTKAQAESFGVKDGYGLWVAELADGSAAAKAGLEVGDVILKADGKKVESATELSAMIQDKKKGDKIKIEFVRDKKPMTLEVEVTEDKSGLESFIKNWDDSRKSFSDGIKKIQDGAWSKEVEKSFRDSEESVKKLFESRSRDSEQVIARQKDLKKKLETIFKERRILVRI